MAHDNTPRDRVSKYRSVRITMHPHETHQGFAWSVHYISVDRGVANLGHVETGVVDDPGNMIQYEQFRRAVARAEEAAYSPSPTE